MLNWYSTRKSYVVVRIGERGVERRLGLGARNGEGGSERPQALVQARGVPRRDGPVELHLARPHCGHLYAHTLQIVDSEAPVGLHENPCLHRDEQGARPSSANIDLAQ